MGSQFPVPIQTGPKAHPACCAVSTGSFPVVNWPGRHAEHLCLSSARVAEWCGAVPPPSICACIGLLWGDLYLYLSSASCHITFVYACLKNCITFVSCPAYTEDLYFHHISPYQGAALYKRLGPYYVQLLGARGGAGG